MSSLYLLTMVGHDKEADIERIVLGAIYEAQNESFFGIKATRLLLLRSDIDKKLKEVKDSKPELAEKLELISTQLLEAERMLGGLIEHDIKPIDYTPVTKKTK